MSKIKDGEYVVATRYSDGDPMDPWAFGFLQRFQVRDVAYYRVVDLEGNLIGPVYRRAQRITKDFGEFLYHNIFTVESSGKSIWWWKKNYKKYLSSQRGLKTGGL